MQVTYRNFDWILGVNKAFYGSLASFLEVESQVRDLLRMTFAGSAGSGFYEGVADVAEVEAFVLLDKVVKHTINVVHKRTDLLCSDFTEI